MSLERRQRIKRLFDLAVALAPHERAAFLDKECAGDESLKQDLESLLVADEQAGDITHENAVRAVAEDKNNQAALAAGTTLDGRYQVKRELERGGLGIVYLARDLRLDNKKVAIKVLRREVLENEEVVRKFKHEMEALARIEHAGVVAILNAGKTPGGMSYIVMQYVEGVSLRRIMTAEGMNLERVARIVKGIGEALDAAHQAGVLHRDLKPSNIMVSTTRAGDEVKLIDFGIAKIIKPRAAESTLAPLIMGTREYMSPEQLEGQPVSVASDIYAFGVIAYEMITGRRPFIFKTEGQLLGMQRAGVRVRPQDLCPSLSQEAENLILRALRFEPRNRYASAREFGDALANALAYDQQSKPQSNSSGQAIELAHVLSTGIVGHSSFTIDRQMNSLNDLQELVRGSTEFTRGQSDRHLIPQSTSDGMTLAFFGDPEAPVRCALEIIRELRQRASAEPRMGIHSGPVNKLIGIDGRLSVAGHGVDVARRIMECGEAGHILLSKRVADDISLLSNYREYLHDLGEIELERGVKMRVVNLYTGELGNPAKPSKCRNRAKLTRVVYAAVAAVLLILTTALVTWMFWGKGPSDAAIAQPTPSTPIETPQPTPASTHEPNLTPPSTLKPPKREPRAPFSVMTARHKLFEVAFAPDGRLVASTGDKGEVRLWRVGGQGDRELRGATQAGRSVVVSPGGDIVASGNDDGTIRLWRTNDGSALNSLIGHTNYVFLVVFSPDEQTLVSASNDKTIRKWRVGDGKMLNSMRVPKPEMLVINISPDQQAVALYNSREGSVRLWSPADDKLRTLPDKRKAEVNCGAFSPDGQILAVGGEDGVIQLWNVGDGRLLRELAASAGASSVNTLAFSPDGRLLASGLKSGAIQLWSVADGSLLTPLQGHQRAVQSLSFSANGQLLASGSDDKTVRLWQIGE